MPRAVISDRRLEEDAEKIARLTKLPTREIKMVMSAIINERQNHKRQAAPPPPEGGISLRAAARKYGIRAETLSGWVKKGYIPILLRTKNWLYINEAKLAGIVQAYKQNPGQGKKTLLNMQGKRI